MVVAASYGLCFSPCQKRLLASIFTLAESYIRRRIYNGGVYDIINADMHHRRNS
jgi:hypothetical protein